jgi:folylpolyglutamate synthase
VSLAKVLTWCNDEWYSLFDATNVFDSPAITAITKLGMDHVYLLGPSLADITRNKAGIMREHTICVTCEQSPEAFEVLMEHSNRLSAPLDDITDDDHSSDAIAALPTVAHRTNAAIALKVVAHLLHTDDLDQRLGAFDEQDVIQGLQRYKSPGSFREITKSPFHFLLDTAHNTLSLPVALEWFFEKAVSKEDE